MLGELNQQQIWNLFNSQVLGRLGCCHNNQVYIVPVAYAFEDGTIYIYTKEGLKVDIMRQNPEVCFEVDKVHDMANWQSAIAWGKFEELEGDEANRALQLLTNKLVPLITSEMFRPLYALHRGPELVNSKMKMVVFKINVRRSTGKYEKSK